MLDIAVWYDKLHYSTSFVHTNMLALRGNFLVQIQIPKICDNYPAFANDHIMLTITHNVHHMMIKKCDRQNLETLISLDDRCKLLKKHQFYNVLRFD